MNGDLKCNDRKIFGEGCINGFWDGSLRRVKRSKRLFDGFVFSIGGLFICNLNGIVEDNAIEVVVVEFEIFSNNESSVIECNKYE